METASFTLGNFDDMGIDGMEIPDAISIMNSFGDKVTDKPCRLCNRIMRSMITDGGYEAKLYAHEGRVKDRDTDWTLCDDCDDKVRNIAKKSRSIA